jgi:hypothetical protein
VQQVVQDPPHRGVPAGVVVRERLLGGIGAQQVMECVTAGAVLGQQVRAG